MTRTQSKAAFLLVMMVLLALVPGISLANAGEVIFVSGTAMIAPEQPLSRGDLVNQGDEIVTGEDGRVQLLMQDGDRIAIRPNTRFVIETFETVEEQDLMPGEQPHGKRIYKVLEGGFRTLTEKAWKQTEDNYKVKTPVATIGVRGTDYELLLQKVAQSVSGYGLFIAVYSGAVWVRNDAIYTDIFAVDFLYIESSDDPGTQLIAPPDVLTGTGYVPNVDYWRGASRSGITSENGTYEGRRSPEQDGSLEPDENVDPDPPPDPRITIIATGQDGTEVDLTSGKLPRNRYIAFGSGPLGTKNDFTGSGFTPEDTIIFDAQGNPIAYPGLYPAPDGPTLAIYDKGTSKVVNIGQAPTSGLRWGRWAGGTASATHGGGMDNIDLSRQSLHWILGHNQTQSTVLPISGVAHYRLVGNTDPTDNKGNVGFLSGSTHLQADFTNQVINTRVDLGINGQQWSAADADGRFGQQGTFAGQFDSVNVNGGQCGETGCSGSGGYSGFFTGGDGSGPPPGAGMGYGMQQDDTSVSGTAAFGDPQ